MGCSESPLIRQYDFCNRMVTTLHYSQECPIYVCSTLFSWIIHHPNAPAFLTTVFQPRPSYHPILVTSCLQASLDRSSSHPCLTSCSALSFLPFQFLHWFPLSGPQAQLCSHNVVPIAALCCPWLPVWSCRHLLMSLCCPWRFPQTQNSGCFSFLR